VLSGNTLHSSHNIEPHPTPTYTHTHTHTHTHTPSSPPARPLGIPQLSSQNTVRGSAPADQFKRHHLQTESSRRHSIFSRLEVTKGQGAVLFFSTFCFVCASLPWNRRCRYTCEYINDVAAALHLCVCVCVCVQLSSPATGWWASRGRRVAKEATPRTGRASATRGGAGRRSTGPSGRTRPARHRHRCSNPSTSPPSLIPPSRKVGYMCVCVCRLLQHPLLYRTDSADYRAQGPEMDSGVEAGSDMTPPTPGFPISPPTPYGKRPRRVCGYSRAAFSLFRFHSGFVRSWKTWKSHGILKWSFPGLEKSWKKVKSQKF